MHLTNQRVMLKCIKWKGVAMSSEKNSLKWWTGPNVLAKKGCSKYKHYCKDNEVMKKEKIVI